MTDEFDRIERISKAQRAALHAVEEMASRMEADEALAIIGFPDKNSIRPFRGRYNIK